MTLRTIPTFCLLAVLAAAPLAAQDKPAAAPAPQAGAKLAEWPPLKDADKDRVLALAGQFRKTDQKLQDDAKKQLLAIGEAAMPLLFQQTSDRAENTNPQLFALFDEILKPAHAALMAREVKKPRVELRRYLVRRLCHFADTEMGPVFESMLKDKDEETVFYSQLGLLALKQTKVLPDVMNYCKAHWAAQGPLVAEVLTPARSHELGAAVFEAIAKLPAAEQMNGLRLARYLMVKDQTMILRHYLEAGEHTVKREAVNAARVLHGEPPIENLPVFQVIEHAKQWLQKL